MLQSVAPAGLTWQGVAHLIRGFHAFGIPPTVMYLLSLQGMIHHKAGGLTYD